MSPTFRFPDLISACVSLVFLHDDAPARIFDFPGTQLVLRPPLTPRRRESMWRPQYELLLAVQRSPANRHPNPKFQLDQLDHGLRGLCRQHEGADTLVLRQARLNMADRAARGRPSRPDEGEVTTRWCWGFVPHAPQVTSRDPPQYPLGTRSTPASDPDRFAGPHLSLDAPQSATPG